MKKETGKVIEFIQKTLRDMNLWEVFAASAGHVTSVSSGMGNQEKSKQQRHQRPTHRDDEARRKWLDDFSEG